MRRSVGFLAALWWAIVMSSLAGAAETLTVDKADGSARDSNTDTLIDLIGTALGCRLSEEFQANLDASPLYQSGVSGCEAVVPATPGNYFTDAECSAQIAFQPTGQQAYCAAALNKETLGNADDLQGQDAVWTLSPGNRYDLGALPLGDVLQPYLQRTTYREIETAGGTCRLEMRVYKSSPDASGLKSIMMLHGGSWTSRGFGFFGLEMTIPHFTHAGYVVFAPFYRLLDSVEANAACHNASINDITNDAAFALDWVRKHAGRYGGDDYPVVFGQSAGGHLAASLAVHQREQVSNALLLYPPTDFTDFALRALDGSYTDEQGLGILERVMGTTVDQVDISASPVPENSFPQIVETAPALFPPMFFLHGLADTLVEARQSVRLCHALNGNIETGSVPDAYLTSPDLRQSFQCNERDSEIHLIREGQHALDVCISSNVLLQSTCLSGSEASRVQVAQAMEEAIAWSTRIANQRRPQPGSDSGGGASLAFLGLVLFIGIKKRNLR